MCTWCARSPVAECVCLCLCARVCSTFFLYDSVVHRFVWLLLEVISSKLYFRIQMNKNQFWNAVFQCDLIFNAVVIASLHLGFAYKGAYTQRDRDRPSIFAHIWSLTALAANTMHTHAHTRTVERVACARVWVMFFYSHKFVRLWRVFLFRRRRCCCRSFRSIPTYYLTRCIYFFVFFLCVRPFVLAAVTWKNFLIPITLHGIRNELNYFSFFFISSVPFAHSHRSLHMPRVFFLWIW